MRKRSTPTIISEGCLSIWRPGKESNLAPAALETAGLPEAQTLLGVRRRTRTYSAGVTSQRAAVNTSPTQ